MLAYSVVTPGQPLECVELPDPVPTGAEVAVAVGHCGVCHSDVHFWEGELDFGGPKKTPITAIGIALPLVLGHEISGRVSAVGPEAEGVALGDLRLVYPWIGCGHCAACRAGRDDLCADQKALGIRARGGFAGQVVVPHPRYLIEIGDLDPALAATLACSGLTAYSAVAKARPEDPEAPIVIIGVGGVGLSAIAILQALGHRNILAVDIDDGHLAVAREAGARSTVNSRGREPAAIVAELREAAGGPVLAVVDFVNSAQTAQLAFALPHKGGKVVMVGLFGGALQLPLMAMPSRVLTLQGSFVGSLAELRELVALARSGRLRPIPIATLPKAEATEALSRLREGRVTGRLVLES